MEGLIPTSAGNSRLAALQRRRRPSVDISGQGIAVVGGDGTPLLTNRAGSISDRALAGVQQRGFGSGREAVQEGIDAAGRTYRTGMLEAGREIADEQREVERSMEMADAIHKQRQGNAVAALRARGEHDVYFSPESGRMRAEDQANKIALANAQQQGNIARASATKYAADADVESARIGAGADVQQTRLEQGSRALSALGDMRAGLRDPTPEKKPGALRLWGLLGGGTPASDPDAAQREYIDQQTRRIMGGLSAGDAPQQSPQAQAQAPAQGQPVDQVRALTVRTFAQENGVPEDVAEELLVRYGVID